MIKTKTNTMLDGSYYFSDTTITYDKPFEYTTNTTDGNTYEYVYND